MVVRGLEGRVGAGGGEGHPPRRRTQHWLVRQPWTEASRCRGPQVPTGPETHGTPEWPSPRAEPTKCLPPPSPSHVPISSCHPGSLPAKRRRLWPMGPAAQGHVAGGMRPWTSEGPRAAGRALSPGLGASSGTAQEDSDSGATSGPPPSGTIPLAGLCVCGLSVPPLRRVPGNSRPAPSRAAPRPPAARQPARSRRLRLSGCGLGWRRAPHLFQGCWLGPAGRGTRPWTARPLADSGRGREGCGDQKGEDLRGKWSEPTSESWGSVAGRAGRAGPRACCRPGPRRPVLLPWVTQ